MSYNFLIIGGDKRINMLSQKLLKDKNVVYTYANEVTGATEIDKKENIKDYNYDIVISSTPLSMDNINVYAPLSDKQITLKELSKITEGKILIAGKIPKDFENKQISYMQKDINENKQISYIQKDINENKQISHVPKDINKLCRNTSKTKCYDILQDEVTTILNTIPTAEGAIQIAMEETSYTLRGKKALVIGFGRVGKTLANMLSKFGLDVYCEARKDVDLAWIKAYGYKPVPLEKMKDNLCKMDIIFNTVPIQILDKSTLILLNNNTLIIDLASAPGGVDYDVANKIGIKAILASALPGKVAPATCAEYLQDFVYRVIK